MCGLSRVTFFISGGDDACVWQVPVAAPGMSEQLYQLKRTVGAAMRDELHAGLSTPCGSFDRRASGKEVMRRGPVPWQGQR